MFISKYFIISVVIFLNHWIKVYFYYFKYVSFLDFIFIIDFLFKCTMTRDCGLYGNFTLKFVTLF